MEILNENPQLTSLNEVLVNVYNSLPNEVEQSIYYAKLKHILHSEIINYCREQTEIKEDLNILRMSIGTIMTEGEIREYLDNLKEKYNNKYENVGIDYHIEVTRIDYGVPVFVIIKRGPKILMKKFVFRFKKANLADGIDGVSHAGIPLINGGN